MEDVKLGKGERIWAQRGTSSGARHEGRILEVNSVDEFTRQSKVLIN
jgi:hypothetical protein